MQGEMVSLPRRGGALHVRRWGGGGAPIAFLHANGLNALSYRRMVEPLSDGQGIIVPDQRGHGRSAMPADPDMLRDWHVYAADAGALLAEEPVPDGGWCLAGHSMGSVICLMVAASGIVPVRGIVMVEPVIVPALAQWLARSPLHGLIREILPVAKKAAARRASFPDTASVRASYSRKSFFAGWAEGVLDDYLTDGLTEADDGVRLSCDPAWEAATFAAQGHSFWQALDRALAATGNRISALYAESGSTASGTSRIRLSDRGINGVVMPGTSHLAPQEKPELVARLILDAFAQQDGN